MAVPTISQLPEAPNRSTDSPSTFSSKADAWADAVVDFVPEANTLASFANTKASEADTSATNAANSESAAATSETNAANSESAAATSESNAAASEANAATSKSAAATSESNAATSETNAAASETNAATSESAAATSETNAAASEIAAGEHETTAERFATEVEGVTVVNADTGSDTGKFSALHHAAKAGDSASAASTSETNAATSESNASTSASEADTDEQDAQGWAIHPIGSQFTDSDNTSGFSAIHHADAASTSASNAATSESNAATSANNAATDAGVAQSAANTAVEASSAVASSVSSTSLNVSTGAKSLTVDLNAGFISGATIEIIYRADSSINMFGTVTSYTASSGALDVDITSVSGSGTFSDWVVRVPLTVGNLDQSGAASGDVLKWDGSVWTPGAVSIPVDSVAGKTGNVTLVAGDVGLSNVPNEDATDPANWDPANTDGNFLVGNGSTFVAESGSTARTSLGLGTAATKSVGTGSTNVPQNSDIDGSPRDIPWDEDARGTVSANQTLDLSAANFFKAEPTANLTFDFTNTSNGSSGLRGGLILLTGGGDHTISWSVGGGGTVNWVGGSAPDLATGTGRDLIAATPISSSEVLLSLVQGDF